MLQNLLPILALEKRNIMSHMILALLLSMVVAACAALGTRTAGRSGPITWRATDFKVQAVGEASGFVGRTAQEVYSFTLVLHESQGTAITFTRVAATYNATTATRPASFEQTGRWELRPHGELRWPLQNTYGCASIDCINPGAIAPVWHIILTGTDNRGQPVRVVIDLRLPANPDAREKP